MAEQVQKKPSVYKRFVKFVKEVRSELKKVIWPSRSQLINYTLTVIVICLILGVVVWLFDALFGFLYTLVFA
ncbi:preprotein translocase subunit SecE [Thermoclostridium stercorarium subsp. thermolacticum DSM 2910]|nr:preprotein translocase subunit SecE [Thermoclostridium stercorarium]AGI39963.1 SecE [Thermoclostridium stercorarium subsp. stercorarium DSM 8532]ANW99283.1 preprotein translocase subunit SecE [Thermoclostridium stercorarium subsp. thermolacticum DSM 2910]ANX01912.1 preprotein translocase subunit SecE [Thermoclostridium stercorarium subsp. leptospartum DSM 9219]UZQ84955.1 preprotein translocase subunit SecE [Thermoclostridium stercorarium]